MPFFRMPAWINPHLYSGKSFKNLTESEIEDLKIRLSAFKHEDPEVSIVIPVWNEENSIFRTLSSLASNRTSRPVEIIVINNNSSDTTLEILTRLDVQSYFQPLQGTSHARQMGLDKAKGRYHLCADGDTLYPVEWIETMIKPMINNIKIVGVYGRYSFMSTGVQHIFALSLYERITGILIRMRRNKHEYMNVLGFNMGFSTEVARLTDGFRVNKVRVFDNALGSNYFTEEAEDGTMALNLLKKGRLKLITDSKARVFTSSRRLKAEGGILKSFLSRLGHHGKTMLKYFLGQ